MPENNKRTFLTVKDFTVSNETFGLYKDSKTDMLVTFPKPESHDLPKYYQSQDYISHTDRKSNWFEFCYQFVKSFALKNKLKAIFDITHAKGKILDIGAGTGDFLVQAKKFGWEVIGAEPNENARDLALKKGITLYENSETIAAHQFDVITMWHVLEHVENLDEQISELKRLLKPDGVIFIAVPNYRSYDAKYYKQFWAAYDVPRHLWHFSKKSIKVIFQNHDFKLIDILPMKFDSFYVSLLSEKYKTGSMNIFRAFYIGLKSNYRAKSRMQYSSHIYVLKNK